jgi:hypothetical protein
LPSVSVPSGHALVHHDLQQTRTWRFVHHPAEAVECQGHAYKLIGL